MSVCSPIVNACKKSGDLSYGQFILTDIGALDTEDYIPRNVEGIDNALAYEGYLD